MKVLKSFKIGDKLIPIGDLAVCVYLFLVNNGKLTTLIDNGYLEKIKKEEPINKEITLL
jgi:hypothetical protein